MNVSGLSSLILDQHMSDVVDGFFQKDRCNREEARLVEGKAWQQSKTDLDL